MEEHGCMHEVARVQKLLQFDWDAPMVDEAHDAAGEVVDVFDGMGGESGFWWRAGG